MPILQWLAREPLGFEIGQIGSPQSFAILAEMAEIGPREEAGVVPVRKGQAHGVVADGVDRRDGDIGLARHGLPLLGTVALNFRRGAEDAQEFGAEIVVLAVVESTLGGGE